MIRCAALLLVLAACAADDVRSRPRRPTPDKSTLYGDATLVPTREGERARRELARAGEIEAAVAILPDVQQAHVTVEAGVDEDRVIVSLRTTTDAAGDALRRDVESVAAGVMGTERPHALMVVAAATPGGAPPTTTVPLALALALVGLGASAGIAVDRFARLRRRRRHRLA